MKATEVVQKMMDEFTAKNGKPATEMFLSPQLYDSLKYELRKQIPADMVIDWIKYRGVQINRLAS